LSVFEFDKFMKPIHFALQYKILNAQKIQDRWELNGMCKPFEYSVHVNFECKNSYPMSTRDYFPGCKLAGE